VIIFACVIVFAVLGTSTSIFLLRAAFRHGPSDDLYFGSGLALLCLSVCALIAAPIMVASCVSNRECVRMECANIKAQANTARATRALHSDIVHELYRYRDYACWMERTNGWLAEIKEQNLGIYDWWIDDEIINIQPITWGDL